MKSGVIRFSYCGTFPGLLSRGCCYTAGSGTLYNAFCSEFHTAVIKFIAILLGSSYVWWHTVVHKHLDDLTCIAALLLKSHCSLAKPVRGWDQDHSSFHPAASRHKCNIYSKGWDFLTLIMERMEAVKRWPQLPLMENGQPVYSTNPWQRQMALPQPPEGDWHGEP